MSFGRNWKPVGTNSVVGRWCFIFCNRGSTLQRTVQVTTPDAMPHIDLPEDLPGILSPMKKYPNTGGLISKLVQEVLRGPSPLEPGQREMIAAYTSARNDCTFCEKAHSATAGDLLRDKALSNSVKAEVEAAPISDKMKALLTISAKVQEDARDVSDEDVARARQEGATDKAIHDTVLITAVFSMCNRYVDGLDTPVPDDKEEYAEHGKALADEGYGLTTHPW